MRHLSWLLNDLAQQRGRACRKPGVPAGGRLRSHQHYSVLPAPPVAATISTRASPLKLANARDSGAIPAAYGPPQACRPPCPAARRWCHRQHRRWRFRAGRRRLRPRLAPTELVPYSRRSRDVKENNRYPIRECPNRFTVMRELLFPLEVTSRCCFRRGPREQTSYRFGRRNATRRFYIFDGFLRYL
jgi:hypothetical protein